MECGPLSKIFYSILITLFTTGCISAYHLSDNENTWIAARSIGSDKVLYCQANKADKNVNPSPKCYEAEMVTTNKERIFYYK